MTEPSNEAQSNAPVSISIVGSTIKVISPFCTSFVTKARELGGKWDGKAWIFSFKDQALVTAQCNKIYGEAGEPNIERVNLVFTVIDSWKDSSTEKGTPALFFAGRLVAKFDINKGISFGNSVVVIENKFKATPGKYLELSAELGTKFILRNLPITVLGQSFEKSLKRFKFEVESVNGAEIPSAPLHTTASEIVRLQIQVTAQHDQIAKAKTICNHMRRKLKEGKLTEEISDNKLNELLLILQGSASSTSSPS